MDKKCKWCGKESKYYFQTVKAYCCKPYAQQCPEFKKKLSNAKLGTKRSKESIIKQSNSMKGKSAIPKYKTISFDCICLYGCGEKAKYIFENKKVCCQTNYRKCRGFITNKKINVGKSSKAIPFLNNKNILCSFGCKKYAKYVFKNDKYCCSEYTVQCSAKTLQVSDKTKKKLSNLNKKPLEYWKSTYPLFSKVEELRYNLDNLIEEKEIQVHCKNHKCKNSKEQGGWFTPTYIQLYERIRQIEYGNGGSYFYCSQECKDECVLYNLRSDPYKEDIEKPYTDSELQTLRQHVLNRDDGLCVYCDEKAEHVHHERPVKLEPFFALDPDLCWSVCKNCHYKYGHQDECSTGNLANKICKKSVTNTY